MNANNPQTNRHIRGQAHPIPATCDCGHAPTPSVAPNGQVTSTGYAKLSNDKTVCYECAADLDRSYVKKMAHDSSPVTVYATATGAQVEFTTWAGVFLGNGFRTSQPGQNRAHYTGSIAGRALYGYGPNEDGAYAALRPYKGR